MHHCLYIQEVLHAIFNDVDIHECSAGPDIPARTATSLATLAALARTCKIFKEPALDVLWREIPSPQLLLTHLLPEDVVRSTTTTLVRTQTVRWDEHALTLPVVVPTGAYPR